MRFRRLAAAFAALALFALPAEAANNTVILTPGSGVTLRGFDVGSGVQAMGHVLVDPTTGNSIYGTAGASNADVLSMQGIAGGTALPISAAALPLPSGAATSAGLTTINSTLGSPFQVGGSIGNTAFGATQSGTWNVRNLGNAGGIFDGVIGAAAAPANMIVGGGVFNSTPLTLSNGNSSALQLDANGYLTVNIKAGAGSGGTALADNAAWTAGTTNMTPAGCEFTTGGATAVTTAHAGTIGCTSRREAFTDIEAVGGTASLTTYGSTPGAVPAIPTNTFVTNAVALQGTNADAIAAAATSASPTLSYGMIYNGTTWDRMRGTSGATNVLATLQAGELHAGEVGNNQIKVQVAQTVTASAYSAGNAIGGLMTIANAARVSGAAGAAGTGGIVSGFQLNSKSAQTTQVDVFFFDANPTGSTCTDKTAFNLVAADFDKVVGIATIPATAANGAGWFPAATGGAVGIPSYFPISYDLASATSIYACAVARGAFTPASTSDVSAKFNLLRS